MSSSLSKPCSGPVTRPPESINPLPNYHTPCACPHPKNGGEGRKGGGTDMLVPAGGRGWCALVRLYLVGEVLSSPFSRTFFNVDLFFV